MIRILSLTLAAALCIAAASSQSGGQESRLEQYFRLRKEAGAAVQANDLAKAETLLEKASAFYPHSPGSLIGLARVEVAVGKPAEAVAHLDAYANLGLSWDIAGDKALVSLSERPDFAPVAAKIATNAQPPAKLSPPTELALLGEPGDIYEGLASHNNDWFVSSVTRHTVLRIRHGQTEPFLKADRHTAGLFGLAIDESRGLLWVAEASGPEIPGAKPGPARTALLKVDLKTGVILARYLAAAAKQFGDVVVGPGGDVYASDSVGAGVWKLGADRDVLEPFVASPEWGSPQGMAVCNPGALVVADYPTGLHRLDLRTGAIEQISGLPTALAGTDGLFGMSTWGSVGEEGRLFMATQNGVSPERLLSVRLDGDCRNVVATGVLAANSPGVGDLTLGAASQTWIGFISRGGWAGFGGDGKPLKDAVTQPPRILGIERPTD